MRRKDRGGVGDFLVKREEKESVFVCVCKQVR